VVGSIIDRFGAELEAHVDRYGDGAVEPMLVTELVGIEGDVAVFDEHHLRKQPDWTFDDTYSGKVPAELFGDHRNPLPLPDA
jgi:hypothetical protein